MGNVFNHTLHKQMWDLICTGEVNRECDALRKLGIPEKDWPVHLSPACQYVGYTPDKFLRAQMLNCNKCPLAWNEANPCKEGSLYDHWFYAVFFEDSEKAREYALQIRDLPVRDGVNVK